MFDLREIKKKKRKEPCEESEGLKQLRELAITHSRLQYSNMPEYTRSCRNYFDKTVNGLTKCIIDFLKFSGHQAERVNNKGRYLDGSKVVTDVLGDKRIIGSGKWIRSSMQKGSSDLSAVIFGKAVKIEIKIKDSQSEAQKRYQQQVERAQGLYWMVRSFDEFLSFYNEILTKKLQDEKVHG